MMGFTPETLERPTRASGLGERVFARLDVTVEVLPMFLAFLPGSVRLIGSDRHPSDGCVRLVLDVTYSGLPGGEWTAVVREDGATKTITFGPQA